MLEKNTLPCTVLAVIEPNTVRFLLSVKLFDIILSIEAVWFNVLAIKLPVIAKELTTIKAVFWTAELATTAVVLATIPATLAWFWAVWIRVFWVVCTPSAYCDKVVAVWILSFWVKLTAFKKAILALTAATPPEMLALAAATPAKAIAILALAAFNPARNNIELAEALFATADAVVV